MAQRSLQASAVGINKAKKAFKRKLWTQEYLASEVGIGTRQPIWKFFSGKPIERHIFMEICFRLNLDWQEIAQLPTEVLPIGEEQEQGKNCSIDVLVQVLRSNRADKIQSQCGTLRLPDIYRPIDIEDIYVSLNIRKNIVCNRWLNIAELQNFSLQEFNRFRFGQVEQEQVPATQIVTTHPKLMVLGKPGSGKTTFLQHIAIQCNQGEFLLDRVPIFIRLNNFAEDTREIKNFSLLNYVVRELGYFGASNEQIHTLLHHGRALILLDGLDEVQEEDSAQIAKKISRLSEDYYKNQFIVACRVGNKQYQFDGFTDVEIADFNHFQIEAFVHKWFVNVGKNSNEKGKALATQFMQKLQLSENWRIQELAATPLLLNLVCCVFQAQLDFPTRRAQLYKQGLEILLNPWNGASRIKCDGSSYHLPLTHKLKLLSQIAFITFERGHHFFAKSRVQQYIVDYLRRLPAAQSDLEILQFNSEAVLRSLETQHGILVEQARGIYSFSHLTFQEYLTARNIVNSREPQILEGKLMNLVSHLTEPRWRKVFLLTIGMLDNTAYLLQLMKQHIDALVASDEQLQQFLLWLNQKSCSVHAPCKQAAIRAFYLTLVLPQVLQELSLDPDLFFSLVINPRLVDNFSPDLALDLALNHVLSLSLTQPCNSATDLVLALSFALADDRILLYESNLQHEAKRSPLVELLQQLKEQLPSPTEDREGLNRWWNANGQTWAEELRSLLRRYRHIGYQWQFSTQQKEMLKQYYAANQLLVECVKSSCEVTPTVRDIEETLLLPVDKISSCDLVSMA